MGYKEHGMWEVLEVLRRAHRGEGRRAIARTTGRTRKTVTRYLEAAQQLGWQPGDGEPPGGPHPGAASAGAAGAPAQ